MADSIYTVAQVNSYIKNMFTQDYLLSSVSVKGEVSNCKYHSSGHIYFTLKDKQSVIACVMFSGNRRGLSFSLQEGMQVIVSGRVDTYERDGKYQLYASRITQDGLGELYEKFAQLKIELEERGLFAPEYKQEIPTNARVIGVVTAPTGAAVRDIISVAKGRDPYIQIVLYPAIVQGVNAAPSIVKGIKALEAYGVDTIIVGRGGGSIEDLWAFNEEIVAQAIFDCSIPIISAVGHETDVTISDYVADARAETPSAAAAMATSDAAGFESMLNGYENALRMNMHHKLELWRHRLDNEAARIAKKSPESKLQEMRFYLIQTGDKLSNIMHHRLEEMSHKLAMLITNLQGVSPLEKLSQGYTFTENEEGKCVSDVTSIKIGDRIRVHAKNGRIDATVDGVKEVSYE